MRLLIPETSVTEAVFIEVALCMQSLWYAASVGIGLKENPSEGEIRFKRFWCKYLWRY
jgi:hypothetical protein